MEIHYLIILEDAIVDADEDKKWIKMVLYKVFEMCYCLDKRKTACSPVQLATVKTWKEYGICREMTAKRAETANV